MVPRTGRQLCDRLRQNAARTALDADRRDGVGLAARARTSTPVRALHRQRPSFRSPLARQRNRATLSLKHKGTGTIIQVLKPLLLQKCGNAPNSAAESLYGR